MEERESTWQERLELEYNDLNDKIQKLHVFFDTDTFKELGICQQIILENQYFAMQSYALCLQTRLNLLKNDPETISKWW